MFYCVLYLAALILVSGTAATNQTFTSSGEMNITSCPITYYGQKYDKIYVSCISSHDTCMSFNLLSLSKQKFQTAQTNKGVITDMSGCRLSGVVYKTNTTVRDPNICSTVTCDVSGVATAVSDCGPMEHCQGNGSCILNTMCTVTGSTVIDFIGRVHSVPDRCGYTLMRPLSIPGLQVLGVFQERRRKDVSFLDRVILQLDSAGVQISLEQGGRVQLNDKELTLNNTDQVFHDVELSRDEMGFTAKISASNHTLSVYFDGNTAQIHMRGTHKLNCGIQYSDADDSTINCNATTEWCNILKQTPFTACNKHINPEPFVTACTRTLCKYPAVDGLKCQFLEAYARVCSYLGNVTVESWRSKIGCCKAAYCQDRFCSAHEFCGERSKGGKPRCHCRAIFASKYRSTSTFGEPTVCSQKSASINLANCLLEDKGIDYSVLHLNDPACKGEMDNLTHMVTFDSNSHNCGAVLTANKSQIIYKNTIMTRNSSLFGLINRHDPVHIDFSCYYSQPDIKSLAIKLKDSSVNRQITSGEWNYNLTMKLYTDFDRKVAIQSSTEIDLDQKVWVELKTGGLDDSIVRVVTDSCWATNQPSPSGSLRYDLIIKGCPNPADETVKVEGNGLGTSNYFSFNMFQFSGTTGDVYLHCRLVLCVRQGDTCVPRCSQAVRRSRSVMSKYEDEEPAFISMAWTY
uniref:Zonadhesin-like n=1 Tax=Sparus aurata TaxID=8175 RepID=A0A671Z0P0_SPAAU